MKNKEFNKIRRAGGGAGGYKCHCCGPKPSDRKAYNRAVRSRIKMKTNKTIRDSLQDENGGR